MSRFPRRARIRAWVPLRPQARPARRGERTRVASVLLAPGITEARGQASLSYVGGGSEPYLDSYTDQCAEERERGDGRRMERGGVDEWGRTRADRRAWMTVLRGFVVALAIGTAGRVACAACPGHQTSIVAGAEGSFRVCPQEVDASGVVVGAGFYRSCTVNAVWAGGGTAKVTVDAPLPGVPYLVRFPAAWGGGGATAYCTNAQEVGGAVAASAIRFRDLGPPATPNLDPWTGGEQVP